MRPGASARSTPSTAWILPNRFRSPTASTAGGAGVPRSRPSSRRQPFERRGERAGRRACGSIGRPTIRSTVGRVMRWKKIGPMTAWRARIGCIGRIRPAAIWRRDVLGEHPSVARKSGRMPSSAGRAPEVISWKIARMSPSRSPATPDDRPADQREHDVGRVVVVAGDDRAERLEGRVRLDEALEERRLARARSGRGCRARRPAASASSSMDSSARLVVTSMSFAAARIRSRATGRGSERDALEE